LPIFISLLRSRHRPHHRRPCRKSCHRQRRLPRPPAPARRDRHPALPFGLGIHQFGQFVRGLGQGFSGFLDRLGVLALHGFFRLAISFSTLALVSLSTLSPKLLQALFDHVDHGVAIIFGLDQLLALVVLLGMQPRRPFSSARSPPRKTAGSGDPDGLLLAGPQVLGGNVEDAVGIQVKGDLDLRHAAGRGGMSASSKRPMVLLLAPFPARPGARGWKPPADCRPRSRKPGSSWSGRWCFSRSAWSDAAQGFDAQRQRGDIKQQHILDIALEHAALNGRADGHNLVRVDALVRILAEDLP
jgi:hypothetical protein